MVGTDFHTLIDLCNIVVCSCPKKQMPHQILPSAAGTGKKKVFCMYFEFLTNVLSDHTEGWGLTDVKTATTRQTLHIHHSTQ